VRRKALDSLLVSGLSVIALITTLLFYRIITRRFSASDTDAFFLALGLLNVVIAPAYNAISSTLIPALAQRLATPSRDVSTLLGATILWTAVGSLLATALLAAFAADGLQVLGTVLTPSTARLVRTDSLILGPLIAIQAVGAVLSAASQAIGRYWVPAVAAVLQQLVIVVLVSITLPVSGVAQLPLAFTLGTLGYLVFLVALWPWRIFPMALTWRFPAKQAVFARLAVPLLAGSIAQQTALIGLRLFASRLAPGAVTAFDLAYRLALAIVEVSSGGALAVALTEWSTAVASGQRTSLASRFRDTLALIVFVILPIPVIAHALRGPLVGLWLSGTSNPALPAMTAAAMAILLWGVPLEISARVYARLLLAQGRTRVQGWLSVLRMAVTVSGAWLLVQFWGLRGLVLGDVLASAVALLALHMVATESRSATDGKGLGSRLPRMGVASVACWFTATGVAAAVAGLGPVARCVGGAVMGALTYIVVARFLNSPEVHLVESLVRASRDSIRQAQVI
jgi:peptidoglycan biosynthesis protein MviN/MurJ (putative lipid II flippase)